MLLGTGCLGADAMNGPRIGAALARLDLDGALLAWDANARATRLRGLPIRAARAPLAQAEAALPALREAGCTRLALDLPADAALEGASRALHALARRNAGLQLAVLTPE